VFIILAATMAPMIVARPTGSNNTPIGEKHITNSLLGPRPVKESKILEPDLTSKLSSGSSPHSLPIGKNGASVDGMKMTEDSTAPVMKGKKRDAPNINGTPPRAEGDASPQISGSLLIQATSVSKVIKGEVHNVLNVMRTDARYVSPLRFMEELPTDEQHPLLLQLRDLHQKLSEWEITKADKQPHASLYLTPFCEAIKGRDISAPVTGAALHAIHKFVLYGFFASDAEAYRTIANTLLLCTFEESGAETESRRRSSDKGTNAHEDEQVVLKLLDLSALVVRCASQELKPDIIVGLLDTCLHVSHRAKRASSLLKSAASDALGQITLEVFSHPNLSNVREAILSKLASLLNPQKNSDAYVVNSLMLVNIALETLTDDLTENEISILQNDVCKFLLGWSTSHDLVILSLTMRVIFNLFQTISNHLKVPLEVFLTSVHLRILEHSNSSEEREVALESLLEFCQEPALMKDLYLNYDCDVNCTNLYAHICTTLGEVAGPSSITGAVAVEMDKPLETAPKMNGDTSSIRSKQNSPAAEIPTAGIAEIPMNALNVLAVDGLLTIVKSIARRVKASSKDRTLDRTLTSTSGDSLDEDFMAEQLTEEEFQDKKKQKAALSKLAEIFNINSSNEEWIHRGKDLGIALETPENVADFLFQAPGVDKAKLGEYLGKGPAEVHPFEDKVRRAFLSHFDFSKHSNFAKALRVFLHKFRMPGEAQCIDRFMEAFAQEYFKQQGSSTSLKSVDASYVLAFSTIMLNTDLHNPMNKNPRMTCEQFIANNRGINDGEDIAIDMLTELYDQIKEHEIQVQRDLGEFISLPEGNHAEHFRAAWGELLNKQVAAASFTPAEEAIKTINQVGLHEKDMFLVIAKPALQGISSAFVRSWDDGCILDCLKGLEQMARIATYFGLDKILNDIMAFLLVQGRDFISGCISLEYAGIESGAPIVQSPEDDETMSIVDPDSPIPQQLLKVHELENVDIKRVDISGSAAYRGLLALNMGLKIVRTLFPRVRSAWPQLIDVICTLRDARALPPGLADLDDFADSDGNVLPLSTFAKRSQKRLDNHYKGVNEKETAKRGWFRMGFFGRRGREDQADQPMRPEMTRREMTANQKTLLQVSQRVGIEKLIVFGDNVKLPLVKQCVSALLESVDKFPDQNSPTFEQHQSFALELAARVLLANRERAVELLPFFLPKFDAICSRVSKEGREVPFPFLVERVVVTVLRTSIHLFQVQQVRFLCFDVGVGLLALD
jgi:brefeldin A-resistance guanine nucleotide exchange factor 1